MPYGMPSRAQIAPLYLRRDNILAGQEVVDLIETEPAEIQMVSLQKEGFLSGLSQYQKLVLFALPLGIITLFALRGAYMNVR